MVLDWLRAEGLLQDVAPQAVLRVAPSTVITGFASVDLAGPGDASFWVGDTVKNETNANGFASSLLDSVRAGLLFVPQGLMPAEKVAVASGKEFAPGVGCIVPVENPYHAMVCFLEKFADSFAGSGCAGDVTSGSFAGGECAGDDRKYDHEQPCHPNAAEDLMQQNRLLSGTAEPYRRHFSVLTW
jgi:UDP-3-O-[3-hydroxymyristoyl] glucosamine N-acyltransferase